MLSNECGKFLLKIARTAIVQFVEKHERIEAPDNTPEDLKEELGVFVTLNKNNELRGCIGYPEPIAPLVDATIDSAIAAATEDPRFPKIVTEEIDKVNIEVTVLTKPQMIKVKDPKEYPDKIAIGRDGLIVEKGFYKGLLLPQVAEEYNMNAAEFLANTCIKAGLGQNC